MPKTTVVAFDAERLNLPTAREWLRDTAPHVLGTLGDTLEDVERVLAAGTKRAAEIASKEGFPVNAQGRYPMVVWMPYTPRKCSCACPGPCVFRYQLRIDPSEPYREPSNGTERRNEEVRQEVAEATAVGI
jgi:hypothetical protein